MTSETVRQAAALPDLNHHEPEYLELLADTKRRLRSVYPATVDWTPYLLGGSGTAAVEAMVTSCVERGPVLVVENGYYSARIVDILKIHRIPFETFTLGWLEDWTNDTLGKLEDKVGRGNYEALLATHNETTVGRLNPVHRIGEVAHRHGAKCLIDAMSSFGADPIDFPDLDAVTSSANKCLHGIPGLSFVLASPTLAAQIRGYPRRTYYLSLPIYESDNPPLTPPIPALRALHQALVENPDGQSRRFAAYQRKTRLILSRLSAMDFNFAVPDDRSSCTLVCPTLPKGWSFDEWCGVNHSHGFALYGCKGDLRDRFFQASVMGEVTAADIEAWLLLVERLIGR